MMRSRLARIGITMLVLNEIRGVAFVAAVLWSWMR